jgi:GNAT superfamily N-acetyltransferase
MYTTPAWRGRGLAGSLLDKLAEEARRRGVGRLFLAASKMGRPVYLKFGFQESNHWLELDL